MPEVVLNSLQVERIQIQMQHIARSVAADALVECARTFVGRRAHAILSESLHIIPRDFHPIDFSNKESTKRTVLGAPRSAPATQDFYNCCQIAIIVMEEMFRKSES